MAGHRIECKILISVFMCYNHHGHLNYSYITVMASLEVNGILTRDANQRYCVSAWHSCRPATASGIAGTEVPPGNAAQCTGYAAHTPHTSRNTCPSPARF